MRAWSARYLFFLVWLQWVDRRATSSFLVGVSLQIVVLGMGLWQLRGEPREVVLAGALRAVLLVGTAVCALSAMSAFQNEFRFQTIWQTFRDSAAFSRLMLARALAMTAITAVPMALPFAVAVLIDPRDVWLALGMYAMSLLVLTAYTHVLTLGLAVAYRPSIRCSLQHRCEPVSAAPAVREATGPGSHQGVDTQLLVGSEIRPSSRRL